MPRLQTGPGYGRGRTATHGRACGSAGSPRTRSACAAGQRSWPGPGPLGRKLSPGSAVMTRPCGPASCRVGLGRFRPRPPSDPDVPKSRICRFFRSHSLRVLSARLRRFFEVFRFTAQFPFRDLHQLWVKPRKSKEPGPPLEPPNLFGFRNSTSLVLSGWIFNPYFSNRFGSTSSTRRASSSRANPMTKSSA